MIDFRQEIIGIDQPKRFLYELYLVIRYLNEALGLFTFPLELKTFIKH